MMYCVRSLVPIEEESDVLRELRRNQHSRRRLDHHAEFEPRERRARPSLSSAAHSSISTFVRSTSAISETIGSITLTLPWTAARSSA